MDEDYESKINNQIIINLLVQKLMILLYLHRYRKITDIFTKAFGFYSFKLNLDNSRVTWNMSYTLALVIQWVHTLTIACVSCIILIRYTGKSRAQFESKN
jgi:hypothetical protein